MQSKNSFTLDMKIHTILFLLGAFASPALIPDMAAQTCRISSGFTADGHRTYKEVYEFDYVEEKPEFPGGGNHLVNFINKHRRYPAEAYALGIQGRVTCSFVVNPDGSISNISVIKGVEHSLNREAVRILAGMPAWIPGKIGGVTVPVRVICAVPFRK